jgi:glycosyltransferase involved in cell wall biosynthesis
MPDTSNLLPIEVIIPAWGAAYDDVLPRALASVADAAARTVVGDDDALQLALQHGASQVVPLARKHPGAARAQGLAAAQQPYVLFMDADDEMLPGALGEMHLALQRDSRAIGVAGYMQRSTSGHWPSRRHAQLATSPIGVHAMLFRNMLPAVGSILLRRKSLLAIPGSLFTNLHAEDWHTALKIRAAGRVRFLHTPVYRYNIVEGSVSHSPRDPQRVRESHEALLHTAEEAYVGPRWSLQLAERFARPYRERREAAAQAYYDGLSKSVNTLDYD